MPNTIATSCMWLWSSWNVVSVTKKPNLKIILNYILLIMLLLLYRFSALFPPLHSAPHNSLRQSPHHCSCPWVMSITSLATLFPILYFTSPWLLYNYLLILLNFLTSLPIPPHPLPSDNQQNALHMCCGWCGSVD